MRAEVRRVAAVRKKLLLKAAGFCLKATKALFGREVLQESIGRMGGVSKNAACLA